MDNKDPDNMRQQGYDICRTLSKNELIGLTLMVLGGQDCSKLGDDIWSKIEPLFMTIKDEPHPIMHQDALVGMADVAAERNKAKGV